MPDDGNTAHLSAERLASYLDGRLTPAERDDVLTHFDHCAECRREMTLSRRVIARAPLAGSSPFGARLLSPAWVALAAASLVLAVALPVVRNQRSSEATVRARSRIVESDVVPRLEVVSPLEDGAVSPDHDTFVWRSASGDAEYRLTITDATGRIVWSRGTTDTSVMLPDSLRLTSGSEYFWSVDALFGDGRSATTHAHHFSIR